MIPSLDPGCEDLCDLVPTPRFRVGVRGLMVAVAFFAALLVSERIIWRGYDLSASPWISVRFSTPVLADPRLAPYVLPGLSVLLIGSNSRARVAWAGIAGIAFVSISWVCLKRPVVGFGAVQVWPVDVLGDLIRTGHFRLSSFTSIHFLPETGRQVADLLSVAGFFVLFVMSLRRRVSRRLVAAVAIIVNGYALIGWGRLMTSSRFWGPGEPPPIPMRLPMPKPSALEIVEGLALIALLGYLTVILVRPSRDLRPAPSAVGLTP